MLPSLVKGGYALSAAALVLVGAAAGWLSLAAAPPSLEWTLVWVAGGLAGLPMAVCVLTGRHDWLEPVHLFALSFLVLFVLRPVFDLTRDDGLFLLGYSLEPTYARALLVGVAGAAAFYAGYYVNVGRRLAAGCQSLPSPALRDPRRTGWSRREPLRPPFSSRFS